VSIGPGAFSVFVYVIVYNCVNVCTSQKNKPFTYLYKIIYLNKKGLASVELER